MNCGEPRVIAASALDELLDALRHEGYRLVGPRVRDGAIVYDDLRSAADLPAGWTDEQNGGHYRLVRRPDGALFGYAVGPQSWKRFLHPPVLTLWRAGRDERGFRLHPDDGDAPPIAFVGVRACELRAIAIQDQVLLAGAYTDPAYRARRESIFVVAVNCSRAGGTCFCASMGSGPQARSGFDLALTEIVEERRHDFVIEAGTERGAILMAKVRHRPATADDIALAEAVVRGAASAMGRQLDTDGVRDLLYRHYEDPRWDEVAQRCLACANCTMVCPTCFCTSVDDVTDLTGGRAERVRRWDSCFTSDFSYIHGGSVRASGASRFRQWITHKLATWHDQFGSSGCVGCGRCITWCPVGIDITEEVRALRQAETQGSHAHGDREL